MEFVDLSRYFRVKGGRLLPFSDLRTSEPIWMTQDLQLVDQAENVALAKRLAQQGHQVAYVRRRPPAETYVDRLGFPRRVILEMTSRCNFMCRMCPQQNLIRPRVDMPGDLYRRVIDEIDEHGVEGLWLYHLGESLLHPEFRDNIRHIGTKNHLGVIWMSTNGQYFCEEDIRTVLESNVAYINFSAHAVTEDAYATVAPREAFAAVQRNLETLYRLKSERGPGPPFLHVQMIEQETTAHEVDAFISTHHHRADITSVNMLEYVNLPNNAFGLQQRGRRPLSSCLRVSRNDCFICSNGHVTLCDAAYNGEIFLGDVNERSLHDIWNGPERQRILELNTAGRMLDNTFCRACTDYDI